ncbi:MAG: glycosyltransferase family 4 protein [Cyanobacteria bacterium P01_D01_bin.156]
MATEIEILKQAGHQVELLQWHNNNIATMSESEKLALFWRTTWNENAHDQVRAKLQAMQADLLHVQNFFPLISPSVHQAAHNLDVPTVQHLRNFRLGCLNAYLYRKEQVCEDCVGRNPWRGMVRRCYRNSLPASTSLWQMLSFHRWRQTWEKDVDIFITPSHFAAQKLIEIGIPAEKLHVKPNFIFDPLDNEEIQPLPEQPTFLFAGRLSKEKGAMILLKAWQFVNEPDWHLHIVGDGPERVILETFCHENGLANVHFQGRLTIAQVINFIQKSSAVLVPSQWYETFGRIVIESLACGRPVICSNLGALTELVLDAENGFLVEPQNIQKWTECIRWFGMNSSALEHMGIRGRSMYLNKFTPSKNYQQLEAIYKQVL